MAIVTKDDQKRARQILREWRKRGVTSIQTYYDSDGPGGTSRLKCKPGGQGQTPFFAMPTIDELPDTEETSNTVSGDAEIWIAAAISDGWDDDSIPS